ncbi:MAG: hypothetical protein OTJ43_09280 [Dehalococcoidia bacterium]|nr:hypothetical protein [Dehalococcoidia bacterium]
MPSGCHRHRSSESSSGQTSSIRPRVLNTDLNASGATRDSGYIAKSAVLEASRMPANVDMQDDVDVIDAKKVP